jgi:hypothetical protein
MGKSAGIGHFVYCQIMGVLAVIMGYLGQAQNYEADLLSLFLLATILTMIWRIL